MSISNTGRPKKRKPFSEMGKHWKKLIAVKSTKKVTQCANAVSYWITMRPKFTAIQPFLRCKVYSISFSGSDFTRKFSNIRKITAMHTFHVLSVSLSRSNDQFVICVQTYIIPNRDISILRKRKKNRVDLHVNLILGTNLRVA